MRNVKRMMALLLCVILILAIPVLSYATSSSLITAESIKAKQDQIEKAKLDKGNLQKTLTDIKKLKEELESKKKNLKKYVNDLDANLKEIQDKIDELEAMIIKKEADIEETERQLEAAFEKKEDQYHSMKVRIQMMYERNDTYVLDILLGGGSFADMLDRMDQMEQVVAYDKEKLAEYELTHQFIEACKMELDEEKALLEEVRAGVELEKETLKELIAEKTKQIIKYESDIKTNDQAIKEYNDDIAAQDELIKNLEIAVAADRKKMMEQNGKVLTYDGGTFKFPLASYTRISDDYGWRIHPTLKVEQFHNGVDFAAPTGTAIYAAYDGNVVAAAYSTTMGNYIMIDHGDGLYTIYMHASALYVKSGELVARGEKIAAVGSTGRSTGPHLHFSVRIDGEYTTPWNYLSQ